eukprot:gene55999-76762_t
MQELPTCYWNRSAMGESKLERRFWRFWLSGLLLL